MSLPFCGTCRSSGAARRRCDGEFVAAVSNAGGFGMLPLRLPRARRRSPRRPTALRRRRAMSFGLEPVRRGSAAVRRRSAGVRRCARWPTGERLRRARHPAPARAGVTAPSTITNRRGRARGETRMSFTFAIRDAATGSRPPLALRRHFRWATATTVAEALARCKAGGYQQSASRRAIEAARSRHHFLRPLGRSSARSRSCRQVVDATASRCSRRAASADGRGVAAVFALGAPRSAGHVVPSCGWSGIARSVPGDVLASERVLAAHVCGAAAFSGRTARGVPNRVIEELANCVRREHCARIRSKTR